MVSALAHGGGPYRRQVLDALAEALETVDADLADRYHDVVYSTLPAAAQRYLERLMSNGKFKYQSEFALRHINRGKAEGEANALLTVLDGRGVDVPEDARDRITTCTDLDQLNTWLLRACTASSIDDLFVERAS